MKIKNGLNVKKGIYRQTNKSVCSDLALPNPDKIKLILHLSSIKNKRQMKVQTIHGVPYYINEANQVFFYSKTTQGPKEPIGTWDPTRQHLQLDPDWQTTVKDFLEMYRKQLKEHTMAEMEKAKALQS